MYINFLTRRTVQSKQPKTWHNVFMGLIFAIIGIALLCFSVLLIKTYNEKNETFIETTSKVVDYKYNDEGLQAIIVEYVVDGQTYYKISNSYSNIPKSIGTEVSIKYNPYNPQDIIWTMDSINIILPIVGVVFILIGVIVVILSLKNGKKQKLFEEQAVKQTNELYNNIDVQSTSTGTWQNVFTGLVSAIIGIALLCFSVLSIKTYNEKNETFIETTSRVVGYKYNDGGLRAIVVEYVVDGQTYHKISNSYSNMPKSIGTKVSIKYNPYNPQDIIWTMDSINIILPIFGVAFTLAGVIVVIFSIKNRKKQKLLDEQQMNNLNQPSSNIDLNNQNNNINTNM